MYIPLMVVVCGVRRRGWLLCMAGWGDGSGYCFSIFGSTCAKQPYESYCKTTVNSINKDPRYSGPHVQCVRDVHEIDSLRLPLSSLLLVSSPLSFLPLHLFAVRSVRASGGSGGSGGYLGYLAVRFPFILILLLFCSPVDHSLFHSLTDNTTMHTTL